MSVVVGDEAARVDAAVGKLVRKARAGGADTDAVLTAVTRSAVQDLPMVDHAGITVVEHGEVVRSIAATDGHALVIDNIQRRHLDGPGYDSAVEGHPHCVEDLRGDGYWPAFSRAAAASTPIRSIMTFPIVNGHGVQASLTLYSDTPAAFDAEAEALGAVYAAHVARLLTARHRPHRDSGPAQPDIVANGKAMLMHRFGVDPAAALTVLLRLSKECNESLEAVARRLVGLRPGEARQPDNSVPLLAGLSRDRERIWSEGAA